MVMKMMESCSKLVKMKKWFKHSVKIW